MARIPSNLTFDDCDLSAINSSNMASGPGLPRDLHLSTNFGRVTRHKMKNVEIPLNSTEMTRLANTSFRGGMDEPKTLDHGFISLSEVEEDDPRDILMDSNLDATIGNVGGEERRSMFVEETIIMIDPDEHEALKKELAEVKEQNKILTKEKRDLIALLNQHETLTVSNAKLITESKRKFYNGLTPLGMMEPPQTPKVVRKPKPVKVLSPILPPPSAPGVKRYPDSWAKKLQQRPN